MSSSRSFKLRGADGREYEAEVIQSRTSVGTMGNPHASISGLGRLQLLDGRTLNRKDERTFVIVQTGEELTLI